MRWLANKLPRPRWLLLLWLLPVVLLAFLTSRYFVFSGALEVTYRMGQGESPYLSLLPADRYGEVVQQGEGTYREILAEPAYLDFRVPRRFERATLTLEYKNFANQKFAVGGLTSFETKSYDFVAVKNPSSTTPRVRLSSFLDRSIAKMDFDTSIMEYSGRYRFVISLPDRKPGFQLYGVHARFEREPGGWGDVVRLLWKKIF